MSYGVIIISRDRADSIQKVMPYWEEQGLPLLLLTEPDQVDGYSRALADWDVEVLGHRHRDMGVGYARQSSLELALERGFDAHIAADDDTIIKRGRASTLCDFVMRGQAICAGGWMQVHNLWYGAAKGKAPASVLSHFGDKVYAINVGLAIEAGGYDVAKQLYSKDTAEMNRISIAAGYLWWIHTGVHLRELGKTAAPGGIAATLGDRTREERATEANLYIYEKWGRYMNRGFSMRTADFIADHIGEEAVQAYKTKRLYREDELVPHRVGGPLREQLEITSMKEER